MMGTTIYDGLLIAMFGISPVVLLTLLRRPAPYGRHARGGYGPRWPAPLAWVVMESPATVAFALFYALGDRPLQMMPLLLFALWQGHYVHRAFVYPLGLRNARPSPTGVVAMGFAFNLANAYLNGTWIASAAAGYTIEWLTDPRFAIGVIAFAGGFAINRWADGVLRRLRRPGQKGYSIPRGGLYEWVSCPNYLGEMLQWLGWAVATWSAAGLAFAVFTIANLLPRALAHHRWYRQTFSSYPPRRKAVVPGVL